MHNDFSLSSFLHSTILQETQNYVAYVAKDPVNGRGNVDTIQNGELVQKLLLIANYLQFLHLMHDVHLMHYMYALIL